jgi:hypothetical protein
MANKKITELPFIHTISGSNVFDNPTLNTVVPVVMYGTTNQITVENYAKFINLYNAHTGSAGNTFAGPQTINNNVTITGNTSIGGTLVVAGKITAQEFFTEITSASIIFESGSTIFGNSGDDTHTFTGSLLLNGVAVGAGELNAQTASQDLVNRGISSVTGSINTTTSSFDSVFLRISSTTGSINTTTSSFNSVFLGISSVTGAMNTQSSSQDLVNRQISSTTGSINTTTASFDSVFLRISSTTGSINTTTSSFDSVFLGISSVTGAMNTTTSSFDSVFLRISSTTGSINIQSSSQDLVNRQISLVTGSIHFVTGAFNSFSASVIGQTNTISTFTSSVNFTTQSLNIQTGSQNSLNTSLGLITSSIYGEITSFNSVFQRISSTTGSINTTTSSFNSVFSQIGSTTSSLIGITNGLMAFTAALDSTYATDAQLYQLYQATASIHSTTASLNTQTGSQDLVNRGISSVTGSINTTTSSFNSVFLGISSVTGAMNTQSSSQDLVNLGISSVTGSLIGITNGLMAFTAALDTTYATDAQLYQLYQATASIHFTTQSLNTQTGSQDLVNLGISTATGSLIGITNELMALTASMKGQAIVSSSQQIIDYNTFARTGSANTFYDTQTISGSLRVNGPLRGNTISGGLSVNGGITGSFAGNLAGVADYASTVAISNVGTTNDTTLYPTFTTNILAGNYSSLSSHASGSFFLNGVTRRVHMEGLVVSGSGVEVTGSLLVTGSITINSGSIAMPNRPAFRIVGTASTDRVAQTTLSGSYTSIDYNEGNYYNNSTGIFTAPIAGLYQIYYNGRCGSVNAQQQVIIYKNGSTGTVQLMWEAPGNTGVAHFGVSGIAKLAVNDTLEVKIAIGSIQFDGNDSWGAAYIG